MQRSRFLANRQRCFDNVVCFWIGQGRSVESVKGEEGHTVTKDLLVEGIMRLSRVDFAVGCFAGVWLAAQLAAGADIDFDRDVRPILASKCYSCHGPDAEAREAALRLDSFEGATAKLESGLGQAVVPGELHSSALWQRIVAKNEEERMPPADSNRKLTAREITLLRQWIESGAKYQQHWAYRPIRRPTPPRSDSTWIRNPIDQFIYSRLKEEKLAPAPVAPAETLIRRLSFDLTGLPPTYQEVQAMGGNCESRAYERQITKLLDSPHYGERMAVRWLDLVRYADTTGHHGDLPISVSPFRDYVIQAFNENMSFDQFTREQLAGDLLAAQEGVGPTDALRLRIASGYNGLAMKSANMVPPEVNLAKYSAERVRNLSLVWMGATVGCAECHNHKFDPYTAEDFYSLASFFADIKERGVYGGEDKVQEGFIDGTWGTKIAFPTPEQEASLRKLGAQIDDLNRQLTAGTGSDVPPNQAKSPTNAKASAASESEQASSLEAQLKDLKEKRDALNKSVKTTPIAVTVGPREMRILRRGDWRDKGGKIVQPAIPRYFGSIDAAARATRLDLADWLLSRSNPLTARVAMNRLWQLFFGRGLSTSLDDFGRQGAAPSHPELLDWLAAEFVESGWNVKHMVRIILTSATYRQSSVSDGIQRRRDPYNALLTRQGRFRLDAEFVRDNAISVGGLLVRKIGGRSVYPYQPAGYYAHLNFPKREYPTSNHDGLWRRSIYTHWQRTYPHPSLMAFDAPSREECTVERARSNTPLSSLVLLNDPIYVEAARAFAEGILEDGPPDVGGRIAYAYRHALSRTPRDEELKVLLALEKQYIDRFRHDPAAASALVAVGERPVPSGLDTATLATWTGVVRVIFNSHEFVTRR